MLNTVYQKLEAIKNDPAYVDEIRKIPEMDKSWIDQTSLKAASRLDSYQAEYKRQKDEAVKVIDKSNTHIISIENYNFITIW